MRHWMVDPDNDERLLKVPPHVVKRIKAEAFAESVEAVKALALSAVAAAWLSGYLLGYLRGKR